jgi:hypothetical protein
MKRYERLVAAARGERSRGVEELFSLMQFLATMMLIVVAGSVVALVGFDIMAIWVIVSHWAGWALWAKILSCGLLGSLHVAVLGVYGWLRG